MANDQESGTIPETEADQRELLKKLLTPAAGGKLSEAAVREVLLQQFEDQARAAATPDAEEPAPKPKIELPKPVELTPEVLEECLAGLEKDYNRGIVVVREDGDVDAYKAALKADKTAGTPWETVKGQLGANDSALLKEAAQLQGKGTLIGVYPDGKLCIKDRGTEPVIYATLEGRQIEITTDTPNRDELMEHIKQLQKEGGQEGQFADNWEIRDAVLSKGLELPPDSPSYEKKGLVAAVEAVTGEDFVRSANGKECRYAVMDCEDVSRSSSVRVVYFSPYRGYARVDRVNPGYRDGSRGAVRVLRGKS